MIEPVIFNGKEIGCINNEIYVSHRDTKKHFYVKGRGYPITNSILKLLKAKGVTQVRIIEHGQKGTTIYQCSLEKYMDAVLICEGGFEQQRCVPIKEMKMAI